MDMQQINILRSTFLMLVVATFPAFAQHFDPGQGYEASTLNGLILDNQESLDTHTRVFIAKREVKKKSQVWNLILYGKEGYYILTSPLTQMSIDNSSKGKVECPVIQWATEVQNANRQ